MSPCATPEQLQRLVHDQLEGREREDVSTHVQACALCQQVLEQLTLGPRAGRTRLLVARSEAQVLTAVEFVQAASASGASHIRILLRHMLPNQTSSLIVKASLDAGTVLLLLSGLSFLGIGAQSPTPEWGLEVATSRQYMFERPWYTIGASAAIFLAVYSMNLAGDALRERLDPRLRNL